MRQIDAWELDELEPEREDRQRDVDDADDVNDADPTPPSVLQTVGMSHHSLFYYNDPVCV